MELFEVLVLAGAVLLVLFLGFLVGKRIGEYKANKRWKAKVPGIKKEAVEKSRRVLGGMFSEQLAPFLPDFPFRPTEARFIGKPIDFIVFKGLDEGKPVEVVFVEVKSGKAQLGTVERRLRDAIKDKRVSWMLYRVPEEITTGK